MSKEHAYAYESGYQDGLRAAAITFWHKMADEQPTDESARYLLLGNGGGLYVGSISTLHCADESTTFRIPNHRSGHMNSKQVKAWAKVPECEVEQMDSEAKDMRGNAIFVGCKVSDGLAAGTVTDVYENQVWFTVEGSIGRKMRGRIFNRPENLLVIDPRMWKRQVG